MEKCLDYFVGEVGAEGGFEVRGLAVGEDAGGRADGYRVGRHVDVYRRVWRNQHIVPDGNAADDARVGADIDIVADFGCDLVFAKRMTDKNTLRRIAPRASRVLR